ncbi:hypothetical protein M4R22_21550 [Acidovorax sp. GBBC 3334]|uniref:hypothetical protein n=1 Tax=Acidovorax sp. GBBC 3334 TaxID=2940496 RepID=UPI002303B9D4|nr:hypothetical protein [Acidovorax sp. GBBC 3334]MDA8457354.1 hypothetical protein [Acidovorax sp. GBBC 3334]
MINNNSTSRTSPRPSVQSEDHSASSSGQPSQVSVGRSRRHDPSSGGPPQRTSSSLTDSSYQSAYSRHRVSVPASIGSPTDDGASFRVGSSLRSDDIRFQARNFDYSDEREIPEFEVNDLGGRDETPYVAVPEQQSWRAMARDSLARVGADARTAAGAVGGVLTNTVAAAGYGALHVMSRAKDGASIALHHTGQSASGLLPVAKHLLTPNPRIVKAIAGHLTHQGVAVGITTALREVGAEALQAGLRHLPAGALLGIEVGMGVTNMGLQVLRQARERRNPDEAARGFHALSTDEWARKTPEEKVELKKEQQLHSDRVLAMQFASLAVNVGFAIHGYTKDDNSFAAATIASEAKVLVYSMMRDSIQSKWGMVKLTPEGQSNGVSGSHIVSAGLFYGGANVVAAYEWGGLPVLALPKGVTTGDVRDVLRGVPVEGLSVGEAVSTTAKMIAVKAAINTVLEAADWFSITEHEAHQSHTLQELAPHIKDNDFGRLKDHVPTRMAIINSANSVGDLVSFVSKDLPPAVNLLLTNGAMGAWSAVNYKTIGATWQAEGAVRAAEDHPTSRPSTPVNV